MTTSIRWSHRVRALLACGILAGSGAVGTAALWSTSAHTVSGTFTTYSLVLTANGDVNHLFTFPGALLPASTTAYKITVRNGSTGPTTYQAKVSSSTVLGRAMRLRVIAAGTPGPASTGTVCTGTSTLVSDMAITSSVVLINAQRPLAAGGSEDLCVELTLPTIAPATLAGTNGSVLFTFDAPGQ